MEQTDIQHPEWRNHDWKPGEFVIPTLYASEEGKTIRTVKTNKTKQNKNETTPPPFLGTAGEEMRGSTGVLGEETCSRWDSGGGWVSQHSWRYNTKWGCYRFSVITMCQRSLSVVTVTTVSLWWGWGPRGKYGGPVGNFCIFQFWCKPENNPKSCGFSFI